MLDDLDRAPIGEPLRATLRMLGKLTEQHAVTADDMRTVLAAGVSPQQIRDALAVAFVFNVINRLSDTFEFDIPDAKGLALAAKSLIDHGYRMPFRSE